MIVSFYSFKGGVGRSMALANVANWLRLQNLKVATIDWDLEAPGLECYFVQSEAARERVRAAPGLIDLLFVHKDRHASLPLEFFETEKGVPDLQERVRILATSLPPLASLLVPLVPDDQIAGAPSDPIFVLSPGVRDGDRRYGYARDVQSFNWAELYSDYDGAVFFAWLRSELEANFDVTLIDTRTGMTEVGGISTREMADLVVAFCAPNEQNMRGSELFVRSLYNEELKRARQGRTLRAAVIPARYDNGETDLLLAFQKEFVDLVTSLRPLDDTAAWDGLDPRVTWDLRIPYTPKYAYRERLCIGVELANPDLQAKYAALSRFVAAEYLKALGPERQAAKARAAPELQALLPKGAASEPQAQALVDAESMFARVASEDESKARRLLTRFVRVPRSGERSSVTSLKVPRALLDAAESTLASSIVKAGLLEERADVLQLADVHLLEWPRLRAWLAEDAEFLEWRQDLDLARERWQASEKRRSGLLAGANLTVAQNFLAKRKDDLTSLQRDYIAASVEKRRVTRLGLIAGAFSLPVGAFMGTAILWGLLQHGSGRPDLGPSDSSTASDVSFTQGVTHAPEPLLKHQGPVNSGSFSPDGVYALTASDDRTAVVWNATTGEATATLAHAGRVGAAAFGPDGARVVTASDDKTARVWDAKTGASIAVLRHQDIVRTAMFSPDGKRVVTASNDGTSAIWNLDDAAAQVPAALRLHHAPKDDVEAASFSPDGRLVVTASSDNTARVWDAVTGRPVTPPLKHEDVVSAASFSPDGLYVVTASWDRTARIWSVATGKETAKFMHEGRVDYAAFSPDGTSVATACWDQTARIWDVTSEKLIAKLEHRARVKAVSFSPDGKRVVTASTDGSARVWDAKTGAPLTASLAHSGAVNSAVFAPDGRRVITASQDGTARVWNIADHPNVSEADASTQDDAGTALARAVRGALPNALGFDTSSKLGAESAAALRVAGARFVVRYVGLNAPSANDLTTQEVDTILDAGLALMVVQHTRMAGWAPTADLGAIDGQHAAANARAIGLPPDSLLWLDLEGTSGPAANVIAYAESWIHAVQATAYDAGLYVGWGLPTTGEELARLSIVHFWRPTQSKVPDIPGRGYQMFQEKSQPIAGVLAGRNTTKTDLRGDLPSWIVGAAQATERHQGYVALGAWDNAKKEFPNFQMPPDAGDGMGNVSAGSVLKARTEVHLRQNTQDTEEGHNQVIGTVHPESCVSVLQSISGIRGQTWALVEPTRCSD